ncbi:hypothetical protein LbFV_ORF3 [Leptopilina boulardi filamentous virus]|uniref:Uncharacterized protein n=1 Tax=Leptopilina boulardi filamentous virus TaxID=552509 RepID=A0A1S5YD23_9VIRU|nr:hypothetical protein LbFV_ORF3 [Leptopilina boulardi filamentous virus]AQQ79923.1 hypothetical protein LbFV_ORF3 [Leptopilina boulardi filamentous virus]
MFNSWNWWYIIPIIIFLLFIFYIIYKNKDKLKNSMGNKSQSNNAGAADNSGE